MEKYKMKKTFLEVMAGEGNLNPSHSQKRVLRKAFNAAAVEDDEIEASSEVIQNAQNAANTIINSEDSRNLIAAVKQLNRQGYTKSEPEILGPHDEPTSIVITKKGVEAIEINNITDDVLTSAEKEQAQPSDQTADGMDSKLPAGEDDISDAFGEEPKKAKGGGMELELSSFFKEIDQNRKFIKN
jgi:hypothetical protein